MKTIQKIEEPSNKNNYLNKRQIGEALFLLKSGRETPTEGELAKHFRISRKTAKKDVDKIIFFFASRGVSLKVKPKKGIILEKIPEEKRVSLQNELEAKLKTKKLDKTERFSLILVHCLLIPEIPTIEDWSEMLNVSRVTVAKDIARVKQWLKDENLKLVGKSGVGFKLIGKERDIRDALVDFLLLILFRSEDYVSLWREKSDLTDVLNELNLEILSNIHSFEIRNFVHRLESALGTVLLYEDYMKFLLYIAVSLKRERENHFVKINSQEMQNITKQPQYLLIKEVISQLCKACKMEITQEEIVYLTERFMTLRFLSEPDAFNARERSVDIYAKYLSEQAEEILGLPFTKDKEFVQLVSAHLRMFFGKINYGIKVVNPFFKEIEANCPLLLKVSERICTSCARKFGSKALNQESQCIALYLLQGIEKMKHKRKMRIAVLCPQSMAITHFLKWKLENNIPEIEVVIAKTCLKNNRINGGKFLDNVDLILSTSPIPLTEIPTLIIPRFLSEEYIEKIRILLKINHNENLLSENKNFVFSFELPISSEKEFMENLSKELYKRGYIKKNGTKELLKAGITSLKQWYCFAFTYASARIGIKPGIAIVTVNEKGKRLVHSNSSIKDRAVITPIFVNDKEKSLNVLKIFKYLMRKNSKAD